MLAYNKYGECMKFLKNEMLSLSLSYSARLSIPQCPYLTGPNAVQCHLVFEEL